MPRPAYCAERNSVWTMVRGSWFAVLRRLFLLFLIAAAGISGASRLLSAALAKLCFEP